VRDRRWDYLYDRQRQPVKEFLLDRFAEELVRELEAWPPGALEWTSEAERARWASGAAGHPRDDVIRLALELARLDLQRRYEEIEGHLARQGHRLQGPAEEAAAHLLACLATEACLELKERADRVGLTRADLVAALDRVERGLFRVTPA
jgi:hypothetical protein